MCKIKKKQSNVWEHNIINANNECVAIYITNHPTITVFINNLRFIIDGPDSKIIVELIAKMMDQDTDIPVSIYRYFLGK